MIKLSTALREAIAVTGSLRSALNNGYLRLYSGAVPASADAALGSATLLNEITVGGLGTALTLEPTAPDGVVTKSAAETWVGLNLVAGTPTFFRWVLAADAGDLSTTAVRLQGTAGVLGSDMFIAALPLVEGAPQSVAVFQLTVPEQ